MIISLGFWSESWNIEGVWASQIFKATKPIDNSGKFKGRELMPCFSIRWYNAQCGSCNGEWELVFKTILS